MHQIIFETYEDWCDKVHSDMSVDEYQQILDAASQAITTCCAISDGVLYVRYQDLENIIDDYFYYEYFNDIVYELKSRVEVEEVEGIQGVVIRLMCSEAFIKKSQANNEDKQYRPWGVTWYHGKYDCEKEGIHETYPQGYYFDQRFDGFYRIPYAKDGEEIFPHETG